MKQIFTLLLAMLAQVTVAQQYKASDFIYPLENVARLYSASFGELRPDHYHSGVDIKTDGVEGKKVVAVADGYISRIYQSPYGYGLALYITHPNGTTSVYGHLSRFRDDVAAYVERERYRTKSNTANLFCNSKSFPVKQGEVIAYSGNSGGSFGPHLHYEIRESDSQRPINIFAEGIITPRDDIAPPIFKVHYIEVDTLQGIARTAKRRSYDVVMSGTEYQIKGGATIPVGRKGYFVVEASDRKNDVTNTFAIYSLTMKLNDKLIYDYQMDNISFTTTRYCNAVSYYPIKIDSRNEVFRLAQVESGLDEHYRTMVNRGVVTTSAGERSQIEICATDDCGNSSSLRFAIQGKADEECFAATEAESHLVIRSKSNYTYSDNGITVNIPASTLYESTIFDGGIIERELSETERKQALSPIYKVLDRTTPLHSAMTISIAATIPAENRTKVGLICIGRSGNPSFIKGSYNMGQVSAQSRNAGEYYVAVDTTPPTLKIGIEEGSNQSRSKYFSCTIADDLSGIASYSATIDGEWIALNLDKGRTKHYFRNAADGSEHTIVFTATDGCGNTTTVERRYIR